MNTHIPSLSPELLKANQRLLELRQLAQSNKTATGLTEQNPQLADSLPWEEAAQEDPVSIVNAVSQLPSHLGWGSVSASLAIRSTLGRHEPEQLRADHPSSRSISDGSHSGGQPLGVYEYTNTGTQLRFPLDGDTVKHYPSIGIAALKEEQAAIYRVWLMCRYLDMNGRGWLPVQDVRKQLTGKESKLRLFCWRRLRQVLGQGHGRFWEWDKVEKRVWLYGAAKTATNLEVSRLVGKPVALPVKSVTAGIGDFKAHLYGAWHSGRKTNNPISREAQEAITSIPERTQRHYCKVAGIRSQTNIAIGNLTLAKITFLTKKQTLCNQLKGMR